MKQKEASRSAPGENCLSVSVSTFSAELHSNISSQTVYFCHASNKIRAFRTLNQDGLGFEAHVWHQNGHFCKCRSAGQCDWRAKLDLKSLILHHKYRILIPQALYLLKHVHKRELQLIAHLMIQWNFNKPVAKFSAKQLAGQPLSLNCWASLFRLKVRKPLSEPISMTITYYL